MIIMSAGMHNAVISGLIFHIIHFLDLKCIHIGSQSYDATLFRTFDHTDHAVSVDVLDHFVNSHFSQICGNLFRRFRLVLGNFRIFMEISPDLHKLRH